MTTRNFVRTPRKEKSWAFNRNSGSGTAIATGVDVHLDLLANYSTDLGITYPTKVTHMRTIGRIAIGKAGTVTTAGLADVSWGIAWVRSNVAAASAGDALIPDPEEPGTREVEWLQRGFLQVLLPEDAITASAPSLGQFGGDVTLDITQMRKQPTPDYRLVLITHGTFLATGGNLQGWVNLDTMLALS